jgi:hypothetical protein
VKTGCFTEIEWYYFGKKFREKKKNQTCDVKPETKSGDLIPKIY